MTLPAVTRRWFDAAAASYDEDYAAPQVKAEDGLVASWLRRAVPPGACVLDVGCGTGWLVEHLDVLSRGTYLGFDASSGMIERFRSKHPGWPVEVRDLENFWPLYPSDWRGSSPRVAVAVWSVLNHSRPEIVLDRFRRSGGDRLVVLGRTRNLPLTYLGGGWAVLPEPYLDLDPAIWSYVARGQGLHLTDTRWFAAGAEHALPDCGDADYVWMIFEPDGSPG